MVCFILQSPPHIDREPVSFITLGSCPPFQSEHSTDLCSPRIGSKSGQGHPQHRVAHIPPHRVREVSPFQALKQQNKLQPTVCKKNQGRSNQNPLLEYVKYQLLWKNTHSHQYELSVYRAVVPVLIFNGTDPQGDTKRERKNPSMPLSHSVGK